MLAKCANPACSVLFRYSSQGKIFRVDLSRRTARSRVQDSDEFQHTAPRRTEFFWLCAECSRYLVVVADPKSRFRVARLGSTPALTHPAAA